MLDWHDEKVLEQFGQALAEIPEIIAAYLVTGDYDYLVKVADAGTGLYERLLRESLDRIQGIRHSRSTFALRSPKRAVSVDPMLLRRQRTCQLFARRSNHNGSSTAGAWARSFGP